MSDFFIAALTMLFIPVFLLWNFVGVFVLFEKVFGNRLAKAIGSKIYNKMEIRYRKFESWMDKKLNLNINEWDGE